MCSLTARKIPIVKSVRRQKQHEPGVGLKLKRSEWTGLHILQKWEDLITADHKILNVVNESICGHKDALVVQDAFTN